MKTFNSLIVKVKDTHEDKVLVNGQELVIPLGYATGDVEDKETKNNKYTLVKIYGEVISEAMLRKAGAALVYEYPEGFPHPKYYRDAETVEQQKAFYSAMQSKNINYDPSLFEGTETCDITEQEVDIRVGDKIYFSYLGYHPDNLIDHKDEEGYEYYKIPFESVYCVVRDGEICMVNGNVFVQPYFGEGYEEIEVDGKRSYGKFFEGTEIVESIKERPEYLQGIIKHIGKPLGRNSRVTVIPEDRVIFTPSNNFRDDDIKDKVEGEEYYTLRQWDVISKVLVYNTLRLLLYL